MMSDPRSRSAHLVVGGALAASLVLAWLLVPSAAELGSHFQSGGSARQARHWLEQAIVERGPVRELAIPLARLRAEQGDPALGLALFRRLDPWTLTGPDRALYVALLAAAGETQEWARAVESLRRAGPDLAVLDALAAAYGVQQFFELQADVLDEALALAPHEPVRLTAAAHLDASIGRKARAQDRLLRLWQQWPASVRADDFALLVGLTAELDPSDAAVQWVRRHADRFRDRVSLVDLARRFFAAGRVDDVIALLLPEVLGADPGHDAVSLWAQAHMARGTAALAVKTLERRPGPGAQAGMATALLCELSLAAGEFRTAVDLAARTAWTGLDDRLLLWLAGAAASLRDRVAVKAALAKVSATALRADPVQAATLFTAAGSRDDAGRWLVAAMQQPALTADAQLSLVEASLLLQRRADALAMLTAHARDHGLAPASALRVAQLWVRTGAAATGLGRLPDPPPLPSARDTAARALLRAAAGHGGAALAQIDRPHFAAALRAELAAGAGVDRAAQAMAATRDWLSALAQVATAQKDTPLLVYSYRQQVRLRPGDRPLQWALARTLLDAGHADQAVDVLRAVAPPWVGDEEATHRHLLLAAWRGGAAVGAELAAAVGQWLDAVGTTAPDAESWVHVLLNLGELRAALPHVARLAEADRRGWARRHVEILQQLGLTAAALTAVWARGMDARLERGERLDAAETLLAGGDRAGAMAVLIDVAAGDAADTAAVQRLVHIWGPRPGPAAVAWLAQRARASTGADRTRWLRHLMWVGAPDTVVDVLGPDPEPGTALALATEALAVLERWKSLCALVDRKVALAADVDLVARWANQCAGHGQPRAAEAAYLRVVDLAPRDAIALRWLAYAHAGQPTRAERWWDAYFQQSAAAIRPDAWRDHTAFGTLLLGRTGRSADAHHHLGLALTLLAASDLTEGRRDAERGRILTRLGRTEDAIAALDRALAAHPCDDAVRADLVALWMGADELERARALVDPPAACAGASK